MALLDEIVAEISAPLQSSDALFREVLTAEANREVKEIIMHAVGDGGKRVRSVLTLLSARLFSNDVSPAEPVAAAVELIHLATLLHDDVIDGANLRRHRETVNSKWGNKVAVLAGDSLLSRAMALLAEKSTPEILRIMVQTVRRMCEGEIMQLESVTVGPEAETRYLLQIERKTAEFFRACCQCGALAGGASEIQARAMGDFGRHVGMAYQIVDDLLDLVGDSADLGKPVGADLRAGLVTLPLLYLIRGDRESSEEESADTSLFPRDLEQLAGMLKERGAVDYTMRAARGYAALAKQELQKLPHSSFRRLLAASVEHLVERTS